MQILAASFSHLPLKPLLQPSQLESIHCIPFADLEIGLTQSTFWPCKPHPRSLKHHTKQPGWYPSFANVPPALLDNICVAVAPLSIWYQSAHSNLNRAAPSCLF